MCFLGETSLFVNLFVCFRLLLDIKPNCWQDWSLFEFYFRWRVRDQWFDLVGCVAHHNIFVIFFCVKNITGCISPPQPTFNIGAWGRLQGRLYSCLTNELSSSTVSWLHDFPLPQRYLGERQHRTQIKEMNHIYKLDVVKCVLLTWSVSCHSVAAVPLRSTSLHLVWPDVADAAGRCQGTAWTQIEQEGSETLAGLRKEQSDMCKPFTTWKAQCGSCHKCLLFLKICLK